MHYQHQWNAAILQTYSRIYSMSYEYGTKRKAYVSIIYSYIDHLLMEN